MKAPESRCLYLSTDFGFHFLYISYYIQRENELRRMHRILSALSAIYQILLLVQLSVGGSVLERIANE